MKIRKSNENDLARIMEIYSFARDYMGYALEIAGERESKIM